MKRYIANFYGRNKNAIGITSYFQVYVEAEDKDAARLKLYDHIDHLILSEMM